MKHNHTVFKSFSMLFLLLLFTISTLSAQTITITSPNGGEYWVAGSTHDIIWDQNGLGGAGTTNLQLDKVGAKDVILLLQVV